MSLRLASEGAIARLRIDRADRRNALTQAMWQAMPGLLREAESEAALRLIVVEAAEGGAFSAGADLAELLDHRDDPDWLAETQAAINAAMAALAQTRMPTVAWIDGDAIGGGCGIALACDLRVASPRARLGITPARLGLVYPLHDVARLVDAVGASQARRLLFSGALVDAEEALRIGLVDDLAPSAEPLVATIAANAPSSLVALKQFVGRVLDGQRSDDAETLRIFAEAFAGRDFREGATAFLTRRRPDFG